jgi:hypothetical protein
LNASNSTRERLLADLLADPECVELVLARALPLPPSPPLNMSVSSPDGERASANLRTKL